MILKRVDIFLNGVNIGAAAGERDADYITTELSYKDIKGEVVAVRYELLGWCYGRGVVIEQDDKTITIKINQETWI